MSLSKKGYNAIQRVLHNRMFRVALNAIWQDLHDELGIGSISKKQLLLTHKDHEKLRNWTAHEVGADPLTTKIIGDRLEAAALVKNEKWATEGVFSRMIRVSKLSGEIPLTQGNAVTPRGTLLSVSASDILVNKITSVILVENGIVARYWYKSLVPEDLATALIVYRGHGSEAEATRTWLYNLPADIKKIGYLILILPAWNSCRLQYGCHTNPRSLNDELIEGTNNKPETHGKQLTNRPNLAEQLPESCRSVWAWMTSEGKKCAVTQERLMVLGWPLRLLTFSNNQALDT